MKSKLTNRLLMTMVVAVMLSVVFAVSSLAAITGGYGVIEGLESGKTYEAASVTINAEGTGKTEGTPFDLDANTNKDLAGLYVVREKGETTWSDVIYVYGKISERKALGNWEVTSSKAKATVASGTTFVPGIWTGKPAEHIGAWAGSNYYHVGSSWMSCNDSNAAYELYALTNTYEKANTDLGPQISNVTKHYNKYYNYTDDGGTRTYGEIKQEGIDRANTIRTNLKNGLEGVSWKYAFDPNEIIPVSDLEKFPITIKVYQWYIFPKDAKAKVTFYVMGADGTITTHAWTSSAFVTNNGTQKNVLSTVFDVQSIAGLPTEGWIVGVVVNPFTDIAVADVAAKPVNKLVYASQFAFQFHWGKYEISAPSAEAPTGLTYADGVLSGLDANKEYMIVPYDINGARDDEAIKIPKASTYTFDKATQAGLWGVCFADQNDLVGASDPGAIVYVYGKFAAREALGERIPEGESNAGYYKTQNTNDFVKGIFTGAWPWGYYSGWGKDGFSSHNYHVAMAKVKDFVDASDADKPAKFEIIQKGLKAITVKYAFTDEEITPISEVLDYNFKLGQNAGDMKYQGLVMKFEAHIMNELGEIETYTYLTPAYNYQSSSYQEVKVDFTNDTVWDKPIPDEGYFVGFTLHPFYGLNDYKKFSGNGTANNRFTYTNVKYNIAKPTMATPTGITFVDGTFYGLEEDKTYALMPYTVAGVDEDNPVIIEAKAGRTEFTLDPETQVGLWSISIMGDDYYGASAPAVFDSEGTILVYNYPTIAVRSDMHERSESSGKLLLCTDSETYPDYRTKLFFPGMFAHNSWIGEPKANSFATDQIFSVPFLEALIAAGDDKAARQSVIDGYDATLKSFRFSYGLVSEEIVPISDVVTYEYQIKGTTVYSVFNLKIENNTMRFDAYVMDTDGTVKTYTYLDTGKKYDSANVFTTSTVDFTDSSKWTPALPEDGYFVGFAAYPFYGMEDEANYKFKFNINSETGEDYTNLVPAKYPKAKDKARCEFHFKSYTIDIPKYPKPEGVTIDAEGNVSGLDPNTLYGVATYSIYGMDYDNMSAIWDGEYTFDLETQKGLWAIIVSGDEYMGDSDPFLVYNKSPDRKDIGKKPEGKEYLDYVNLGGKAAPQDGIWAEEKLSFYRIYTPTYTGEYSQYQCGDLNGGYMEVDLEKAIAENDTDKISSIRDTKIERYQESSFMHYIYAADEIIPIQDLFELKFGIRYQNGQSKFTATHHVKLYVMDVDGKVSEYLYVGPTYDFSTSTGDMHTVTVDVQSIEGLPTEGWVVGFRYEPFGEIKKDTLVPRTSPAVNGAHGLYFYFYTSDYKIKEDAPKPDIKSFPVIAGGYGEVSGLDTSYLYEYQYSTDDGASWTEWADVPAGATAFKVTDGGIYRVRVKGTDRYYGSDYDEEEVGVYTEADGEVLASEVVKMHLPNDFVQLSATYEMDLTVKNWVSTLALNNIKAVAPDSVITLTGDGYKFVVTASKIVTDKKVHYYNMAVSLDGESRYNTLHDKLVEMAGKEYVTDVYFESSSKLPFEEAQVMIELGAANDGADVELRSYNERIDKLRKVEEGTVYDGWVTFNNFGETYVIIKK